MSWTNIQKHKDNEESSKIELLTERTCFRIPYGKMHRRRRKKNNKRLSSSSFSRVYVYAIFCYSAMLIDPFFLLRKLASHGSTLSFLVILMPKTNTCMFISKFYGFFLKIYSLMLNKRYDNI